MGLTWKMPWMIGPI
ncbi:rCG63053 [Rattus norvegicus]|uniref:RCG63053 n=1 Tax=Rattus norvegicus TaxID=10116 RepID=A6KUW4_RAT|nr:rCG63053 [Rattus norvegicus]